MDDNNVKLSLAGIWSALSAPVMALAEELALRRASVEHPAMELRIRSGAVDAMRLSGGNREVLLTAAGRPQLALKDVIQQLPAGIGPDVALSFAADQSISQQITLPQQPDDVLRAIVATGTVPVGHARLRNCGRSATRFGRGCGGEPRPA